VRWPTGAIAEEAGERVRAALELDDLLVTALERLGARGAGEVDRRRDRALALVREELRDLVQRGL
jgi:hypothetical protein